MIKKDKISSCSPAQKTESDMDGDCRFFKDGNLTVFETPSPYPNNMVCEQNVTCSDPNHTVQYEFEYFETESGYDRLFVNGEMFQGYYVPINEWIDSFSSQVDLLFISDYMVTKRGFKMNLKCDVPKSPEPTSNDVTTASSYNECYFEDFGGSAIFDTGSPYRNKMRQGFTFKLHPHMKRI